MTIFTPPPPLPDKESQLLPYGMGSEFHNLTSEQYKQNNKCTTLSPMIVIVRNKNIKLIHFHYSSILATHKGLNASNQGTMTLNSQFK